MEGYAIIPTGETADSLVDMANPTVDDTLPHREHPVPA
jgi:hypothetical protein